MAEGVGGPHLDDFGITEDDLARAPCLFLAEHRMAALAGVYLAAAAVLFALILSASHSYPAAALFTVIALAAGSVLLLPFLTLVLCASERAEERWLCRRFPKLSACLAYRRAVAEHARGAAAAPPADPRERWATSDAAALTEAVAAELRLRVEGSVQGVDRESTGIDLVVTSDLGPVLVRCEPGPGPVEASVGREMAAAVADHRAVRAVLVTGAELAPALADYLVSRPISTVPPWRVGDELER
jgi:hypothetical protein